MSETATAGIDRSIVEGVLRASSEDRITLFIPGTDYKLHLAVAGAIDAPLGSKVRGRVRAVARRIDVIAAGGRYIEPVEGRPRRIQGRITSVDEVNNTLTVRAAVPVICKTNGTQTAGSFKIDQMVSFDVEPGARFEPQK